MGERRLTEEEKMLLALAQQRFDITGIVGPPGTFGGSVRETGRSRNPPFQYQLDLLDAAELNYNQKNALRIKQRAQAEEGEQAVIDGDLRVRDIIGLLREAAWYDKKTFLAYNELRATKLRIHIDLLRADIEKHGRQHQDRELIYLIEKLRKTESAIRHIESSPTRWDDPNSKMIIRGVNFESKPTIATGRSVMEDAARVARARARGELVATLVPDRPRAPAIPLPRGNPAGFAELLAEAGRRGGGGILVPDEHPVPVLPGRQTAVHPVLRPMLRAEVNVGRPRVGGNLLEALGMAPPTILVINGEEITRGAAALIFANRQVPNINVFLTARAADIYRVHNMNQILIHAVRLFVHDGTAQILEHNVSGHQLFLFQLSAAGSHQTGLPRNNSVIILTIEEIILQIRLNEQTRTIVVPRAGTPVRIIYDEIRRTRE